MRTLATQHALLLLLLVIFPSETRFAAVTALPPPTNHNHRHHPIRKHASAVQDLERLQLQGDNKIRLPTQQTKKIVYGLILGGLLGMIGGQNAVTSSGPEVAGPGAPMAHSVAGSSAGAIATLDATGTPDQTYVKFGAPAGNRLLGASQGSSNGAVAGTFGGGAVLTAINEGYSSAPPPGMDELSNMPSPSPSPGEPDPQDMVPGMARVQFLKMLGRGSWGFSGHSKYGPLALAGATASAMLTYFQPEILHITMDDKRFMN